LGVPSCLVFEGGVSIISNTHCDSHTFLDSIRYSYSFSSYLFFLLFLDYRL